MTQFQEDDTDSGISASLLFSLTIRCNGDLLLKDCPFQKFYM